MANVHGTSIALGAGIAAAVAVAVFFAAQVLVTAPQDDAGVAASERELVLLLPDGTSPQQPGTPQPDARAAVSALLENGSPALGGPAAPVTLVEFGDYQCHFCNVFYHDTEGAILANYVNTGKVRMIFKDYHIIGPDSVEASHATHCAGDQGVFWEYHDMLYDNWGGENTGWVSYDNLEVFALALADEIGRLDVDAWGQCMEDRRHSQKILASNEDARVLGVDGTPSFFVIGHDGKTTQIVGAQPYSHFASVLDMELARAEAANTGAGDGSAGDGGGG